MGKDGCHQNPRCLPFLSKDTGTCVCRGVGGWKEHLMGKDGCHQNPRHLPFLSKDTGTCVCRGGGWVEGAPDGEGWVPPEPTTSALPQ